MSTDEITRLLGSWEGYCIGSIERHLTDGTQQICIELLPATRKRQRCSACGGPVAGVHEYRLRRVQDLPILGARTTLLVWRRRLKCPRCGPKLESLPWLERYARVTTRLAESVALLCGVASVKQVADFYALDWKTVKAIDKLSLRRQVGPVDLSGVTLLAMDEFAIQKGHRYATVVIDARTKRVLWLGRGRSRQSVTPFFEALGGESCARIEAVAMDMNAAYELEVRTWCPQAVIVFDLFHLLAKYGREVIDRVRVDEANRLQDDPAARRVIKGARWLLLRNRENLAGENDQIRLRELLAANEALMQVYVLKDDLKQLWGFTDEQEARRFWGHWLARAMESGIAALMRFAERLKGYLHGILAHCRYQLHTSVLEGINNRIKVIKRVAYGYRDDEYFFLKVRAAFPGIGR